jgi:hypothetical protein
VLQLAQIAVLLEMQLAPMAAIPFEQVQKLAWQETPLIVHPVLQLTQIAMLFAMQLAPVAAIPFEQVQTVAWQA